MFGLVISQNYIVKTSKPIFSNLSSNIIWDLRRGPRDHPHIYLKITYPHEMIVIYHRRPIHVEL